MPSNETTSGSAQVKRLSRGSARVSPRRWSQSLRDLPKSRGRRVVPLLVLQDENVENCESRGQHRYSELLEGGKVLMQLHAGLITRRRLEPEDILIEVILEYSRHLQDLRQMMGIGKSSAYEGAEMIWQ